MGGTLLPAYRRHDCGALGQGVPILLVAMPAIRYTKSTSKMSYLNELYRALAEKAGII
jgi:hypothetical protein